MRTVHEVALPGNPIVDQLAEGKPINQANALLHCASEIVMVNDCNQGADLEQWIFLPQLLCEFHTDGFGRHLPNKRIRIVGFRENIFTESEGIVGRSGALNEFTFGTIIQRELHVTLGARLHYGHPDCFDFCFVVGQGGMSKMSKTINVSEDIFGGLNVVARGGKIDYADYMHIDKGRDVQYDAALGFEGKIAGGTSVHTLSRDYHRMMSSPLAFFHKVSLYVGAFGYFFSNLLLVNSITLLTTLHAVVSLLPEGEQFLVYAYTASYISIFNIGYVYLFALVVQLYAERGIKQAIYAVYAVLVSIPLSLCKMKTHNYYVHRGLALGLAKYVATGRDLPTKRVDFVNVFTRYCVSHLSPAFDLMVLLLVFLEFSALGSNFYIQSGLVLWLAALSWFLGPALYNPLAFSYKDVLNDITTWGHWLRSEAFQTWLFGQEASSEKGDLNHNNWYSWLNMEPTVLKVILAAYHSLLYGTLSIAITLRLQLIVSTETGSYKLPAEGLQWILILMLLAALLYAAKVKREAVISLVGFVFIALVGLLVYRQGIFNILWKILLLAYIFCQALQGLLQLALVFWAYAAPIKGVRATALIPSSSQVCLVDSAH